MTDYTVKRLALVLAVQAEIEGMKAENMQRMAENNSPAYTASSFNECQLQLINLAHCHDEQL